MHKSGAFIVSTAKYGSQIPWISRLVVVFLCSHLCWFIGIYMYMCVKHMSRAREIDKRKSVQPFHKQSAISMSKYPLYMCVKHMSICNTI